MGILYRWWLFTSIIICSSKWLKGQSVPGYALAGYYGFIWGHNPPVYHLAQSHTHGLALAVYGTTDTTREWQRAYHYPLYGGTLLWLDYGNPTMLGQSIALIPFIQPDILWHKRIRFSYRLGTGLVYNTRVFDKHDNPENLMLSSKVCMAMQGGLHLSVPLWNQWHLNQSIELTHFSNGAYRMPNAGINNISASIGFSTHLPERNPSKRHTDTAYIPHKRWIISSHATLGWIERYPTGGPKYHIWHWQSTCTYRLGRKSGLMAGLDAIWNKAIKKQLEEDGLQVPYQRVGLIVGHELYVSKVSLLTQLGYYLYNRSQLDPPIYQRYGLKIYLSSRLYGALMLKTHYARAECFEWGLGFQM